MEGGRLQKMEKYNPLPHTISGTYTRKVGNNNNKNKEKTKHRNK